MSYATITFTEDEMKSVCAFCKRTKGNYHMLIRALKGNTFRINLDNPCVFWIPQQNGLTGVNLFELRRFIDFKKEKYG